MPSIASTSLLLAGSVLFATGSILEVVDYLRYVRASNWLWFVGSLLFFIASLWELYQEVSK